MCLKEIMACWYNINMKTIRGFKGFELSGIKNVILFMPHPDDESFTAGGLSQKAKKAGLHVRCIVFSKGEAGINTIGLATSDDLVAARYEELQNALAWIGVEDYGVLDFPDSYLSHHEDAMRKVVETEIAEYPNAVAVTFEPDGAYGHPDHIILSKVVTDVCKKKKVPLLYATITDKNIIEEDKIRLADDFENINPLAPTHTLKLSPMESWRKLFALSSHTSQFGALPKQLMRWVKMGVLNKEYFHLKRFKKK